MGYRNNIKRSAALTIFALATFVAHADDTTPPPWRLGNATATVQEWDFVTPTLPLAPDGGTWGSNGGGYVNPWGVPQLTAGTSAPWNANVLGRTGVYTFAGPNQLIKFDIPNWFSSTNAKDMWIQASFFAAGTPLTPDVFISSSAFNGAATLVNQSTMSDGWTHANYSVHMASCPSIEQITFVNNTPVVMALDEVVVDTICTPVPEPASMAILGVGVAALIRRKKRAK
jgi:hypothetical protein